MLTAAACAEIDSIDFTSFYFFHISLRLSKKAAECFLANDRLGICINRFCFCPYLSTTPRTRERILRQCILPHGNLTPPRISARRPHWLRRLTVLCSYRFNARPVTGRKYHYCFCLSWPSVRMRRTVRLKRSCGLSALADGRRKVKNALCYSVFKERAEAIEKAPSLFQPKKQGGYNQIF